MKAIVYFCLFLSVLLSSKVYAQSSTACSGSIENTKEDRKVFYCYLHAIEAEKNKPFGELILQSALFFLETPYVASTLEKAPERLVVNLRELDCTTLVENVIALSRTMKGANPTFENFCHHLKELRYRGEVLAPAYLDRLHYFSDWIFENERKGIVKDVTKNSGGESYHFSLSFMSTHPDSYPQLKDNPNGIQELSRKEKEISARNNYHFIKKERINQCHKELQDGDIVCFVTQIKGLDMTHVGVINKEGDTLNFIHASTTSKKVIKDPKTLQKYAENIKSTIGIMVVRPIWQD